MNLKINRPTVRIIFLLLSIAFVYTLQSFRFTDAKVSTSNQFDKSVPLIELKGTPYNKGLQHGKTLKNEIAEVFAKWKANIRATIKGDPDSMLTVFSKAMNFMPITKKHTPGLLEEIKGIAKGSGQSFEDVFAFQLVDEFWVYLDKEKNIANHHCSGLGVSATANHPAYIAQNMDLENYMNGYQVLFHMEATKTEPEQYILSCAGLVCLNGMNRNGIGLCVNTLMELQASTDGLPVAFMIRGILAKQTGKEALDFLQTVKHASGQNYILGIADSVYDFEASSNQVVRFLPKAENSAVVYHTNHALVNHDVKDWYKDYHQKIITGQANNMNSPIRFASLDQRLNKPTTDISLDVIKTTLQSKDNSNNPVCRVFTNKGFGFTFSSVVFTLGGKRSVQLTYGSPDQSQYKEYFFK